MQTLDDLKAELAKYEPGFGVAIHVDLFRRLFPGGESDPMAIATAEVFAEENDCVLVLGMYAQAVYFRKKNPNEVAV